MMSVPTDPDRRAALVAMQLGALVREHARADAGDAADAHTDVEIAGFGGGAGAVVDGTAWVFLDTQPERGLGAALAWAVRHGASALHVLATRGTGVLARRAEGFAFPITVSHVEGRALVPAIAEALAGDAGAPDAHRDLAAVITAGGAQPTEEHGVLAGEVRGLEVCRVVDDPDTGMPRLEVGVGAHDREIFQMLHGNRPTVEALAEVVAAVSEQRRPGAVHHPLNRLAMSRALRSELVDAPHLIGASEVAAASPPFPRDNLKDEVPCVATATVDGRSVAVVCTTGVDLDVVPYAVDACAAIEAAGRQIDECLVVAPARDVIGIQQRLAALVARPTRFVPVDVAASANS